MRLVQIAMDGSQKIPQRWLETLTFHQYQGLQCTAILTALASWISYVKGDGHTVEDLMAEQLAALWKAEGRDGVVAALFGAQGFFMQNWIAPKADKIMLKDLITVNK